MSSDEDAVKKAKYDQQNKEALRRVISYYTSQFGVIALTILVAVGLNIELGFRLNPAVGTCLAALFYSGGTLGFLIDPKVTTWGGKTLAEKFSTQALIICYILGTACTVLSISFLP